jgi:trehalose synthase
MTPTQTQTTPPQIAAPPAEAKPIRLGDYISVLGAGEIDEMRVLAQRLRHRSVQMVNSTAVGGGVAEMLSRIVPIMEELELAIR